MIHYECCPVCNSKSIEKDTDSKDYTVSKEIFPIWKCHSCSFKFTQDVPSQNAIGRYYKSDNYVSHSDTKKGLIHSLYHAVRSITLKSKRNLIISETKLKKGNILDIGCGTGAFLSEMKSADWSIVGLEPDQMAAEKASSLYGIQPQNPIELFSKAPESFDAITMWHVLEHVHQLEEYIVQLKKILKKDGVLFIAVPNYTSFDSKLYKDHWAGYDVPRHLYHFSPKSMEVLMNNHGFNIKKIKPMWFDPFYVSMLGELQQCGKNNILKAFMIGLITDIISLFRNNKCTSLIYVITK